MVYCPQAREAGPILSKTQEVRPMSAGEIIALLMLIIAAISLGHNLKK